MFTEINIDALVGPTHHFGGLGVGNLASQKHAHHTSRPRDAALEGLHKAAWVARQGVPQYLLLPPPRPLLNWLRGLGRRVDTIEQLTELYHTAPHIFSAACSSSFMWAANSATVSSSCDTGDGNLHISPANLISSWHRATEATERQRDLKQLFGDVKKLVMHRPLPAIVPLRDEGAANHMRLCTPAGDLGFNVFVFGEDTFSSGRTSQFLPRQTHAACEAIARRHQLDPQRTFFLRQNPDAVSAGVFHNDVIASSHQNLLIHHELAFIDGERELQRLADSFQQTTGYALQLIQIPASDLSLDDAVRSYFFNSQIISPREATEPVQSSRMVLISPQQCSEIPSARRLIDHLIAAPDNRLDEVQFVSLEQSMAGGGGPACLRLRVPLADHELERLPRQSQLDQRLEDRLTTAIERWYPETFDLRDLCNPEFVELLLQVPDRLLAAMAGER